MFANFDCKTTLYPKVDKAGLRVGQWLSGCQNRDLWMWMSRDRIHPPPVPSSLWQATLGYSLIPENNVHFPFNTEEGKQWKKRRIASPSLWDRERIPSVRSHPPWLTRLLHTNNTTKFRAQGMLKDTQVRHRIRRVRNLMQNLTIVSVANWRCWCSSFKSQLHVQWKSNGNVK